MPDAPDKALTVGIKIVEDTAGGDAALAKFRDAQATFTKDLAAHGVEATDSATAAHEKLNKKLEEGAEDTEKLELNHHALHQIMHMIGHETAPELGHALTGALSGNIGIAIALGAAMEYAGKKIEEARARAAALADEIHDNALAALDGMVTRAEALKSAIDNAGQSADKVKTSYENALATLNLQIAAHKTLTAEIQAEELARVASDPAATAALQKKFAKENADYEIKTDQEKRDLFRRQIKDEAAAQTAAVDEENNLSGMIARTQNAADVAAARQGLIGPDGKPLDRQTLLEKSRGMSEADAQNALAQAKATEKNVPAEGGGAAVYMAYDAEQQLAAVKALEAFDANTKTIKDNDAAVARLTAQVELQKSAANEHTKAMQEAIEKLREENEKHASAVAQEELARAIKIADATRGPNARTLTPDEQTLLLTVGRNAAGQNTTLDQAEQMIFAAEKNKAVLDGFYNRVVGVLEKIGDFSKFEKRMADLERRIDSIHGFGGAGG